MNKIQRWKTWLTSDLIFIISLYYITYIVILTILGKKEPWIEASIEFRIFYSTCVFLYTTIMLANFVMSWIKGKNNVLFDYFTADWFSVHKLFRGRIPQLPPK